MALNMTAVVRSTVVVIVAVLFVATLNGGQGLVAARHSHHAYAPAPAPVEHGGFAYAPAPVELEAGLAFALLPSFAAPAVIALLSVLALKHL